MFYLLSVIPIFTVSKLVLWNICAFFKEICCSKYFRIISRYKIFRKSVVLQINGGRDAKWIANVLHRVKYFNLRFVNIRIIMRSCVLFVKLVLWKISCGLAVIFDLLYLYCEQLSVILHLFNLYCEGSSCDPLSV